MAPATRTSNNNHGAALGGHNGQVVNVGLGSSLQLTTHHEAEKAKIVSVHLDDKALLWHRQFVKIIGENVGWGMYKNDIVQRFGSVFEDPMPDLKNAKYEKSAKDYQDMFDTLLYRVDINQEHVGGSINGMSFGSNSRSPLLVLPTPNTSWKFKPNTPVTAPIRKQLSQKEYQEKRAQNLCFYCDQKYTPRYKCSRRLYSLVVCPAEEEEFFELKQEEEEVFIQEEIPQISLNALNGSNNLQIIRVTGKIGKHELHILVDCGSTHNFLDEDVANKI
ncbi:hypothetical protein Tco_1287728, partial [Tanacetum coccineum]